MGTSPDTGPITADGCPVEIYRMLPAMGQAELIDDAIGPGSLVLDLGAGTGRIADALVELGHTVVAVDNSPDMLAAIRDAETVLAVDAVLHRSPARHRGVGGQPRPGRSDAVTERPCRGDWVLARIVGAA